MKNVFIIPTPGVLQESSFAQFGSIIPIEYNKRPMMEALLSAKLDKDTQHVFCAHDDVYLRDNDFLRIANEAFKMFDYWGVAGTNMLPTWDPKWHVPFGNKKYNSGLMEHQTPEGQKYVSFYGPYPAPATVFDGVFMAFKRKVFEDLRIVPELDGFHMYDMDMCTQAWELGYKGGVVGLHLYHQSRGEGILTENWRRYAAVFSQRWNKYKIIGV